MKTGRIVLWGLFQRIRLERADALCCQFAGNAGLKTSGVPVFVTTIGHYSSFLFRSDAVAVNVRPVFMPCGTVACCNPALLNPFRSPQL